MQFIVCWHILQRYEIMFGKSARSRAMIILLEKGLISLVWSQKLRLFNKQHKKKPAINESLWKTLKQNENQ